MRAEIAAGLGDDRKGLRLGPVANRALHPRFRLSRVQCRCRRPQGVRRGPAACRRGRTQMAEPSLCERGRSGGQQYEDHFNPADTLPVLLCRDHRPPDRAARCDPEAARDRSLGHPHADRDRVLAAARVARSYRHARQRSAAAADRAGLFLGQLAAFCRPDPEDRWSAASARISSTPSRPRCCSAP